MTTIVRTVQFSAGHRLWQHESKCAHIHGHNYVVEFHATAEHLDSVGRVIDFSVFRDRLGGGSTNTGTTASSATRMITRSSMR